MTERQKFIGWWKEYSAGFFSPPSETWTNIAWAAWCAAKEDK